MLTFDTMTRFSFYNLYYLCLDINFLLIIFSYFIFNLICGYYDVLWNIHQISTLNPYEKWLILYSWSLMTLYFGIKILFFRKSGYYSILYTKGRNDGFTSRDYWVAARLWLVWNLLDSSAFGGTNTYCFVASMMKNY